jgi:hypothetical protein
VPDDVSEAPPAGIRLESVDIVCLGIERTDAGRKKGLMAIEKQGIVQKRILCDETGGEWPLHRITADARETGKRERGGAQIEVET